MWSWLRLCLKNIISLCWKNMVVLGFSTFFFLALISVVIIALFINNNFKHKQWSDPCSLPHSRGGIEHVTFSHGPSGRVETWSSSCRRRGGVCCVPVSPVSGHGAELSTAPLAWFTSAHGAVRRAGDRKWVLVPENWPPPLQGTWVSCRVSV